MSSKNGTDSFFLIVLGENHKKKENIYPQCLGLVELDSSLRKS